MGPLVIEALEAMKGPITRAGCSRRSGRSGRFDLGELRGPTPETRTKDGRVVPIYEYRRSVARITTESVVWMAASLRPYISHV